MTKNQLKNQMLASKLNSLRSDINEASLRHALSLFFKDLQKKLLNALEEYWNDDFMVQGQIELILAPIFESQKDYYDLLLQHNLKEFKKGQKTATRLVDIAKGNITGADKAETNLKKGFKPSFTNQKDLFGTLKYSEDLLRNQTFVASEYTMNRVDSDINNILEDGYKSGKGINAVRDNITKRFTQLETWESQRIARTEIHNAQEIGIMNGYETLGVEYTEWDSAHDMRVRGLKKTDKADHVHLSGEIIPMGGIYSNGLRYPGDRSGPVYEWINCRCGNLPFIMPDGYTAPPGQAQFRENEIVKIDVTPIKDLIQQIGEPNGIKGFTESQNKKYQELLDMIEDQKAKLVTAETEGYKKQLKGIIRSAENKLKELDKIAEYIQKENINVQQLSDEYLKISEDIDMDKIKSLNIPNERKYTLLEIKNLSKQFASDLTFESKYSTPTLDQYKNAVKSLSNYKKKVKDAKLLIKEVEDAAKVKPPEIKPKSKPKSKPKPKPKKPKTTTTKTTQTKQQTLEDEMGITAEGYTTINKFITKHKNKKTEYGQIIDLKTGELYSPEFHGGKHSVKVKESGWEVPGYTEKQLKKLKKENPFEYIKVIKNQKHVSYVKSPNTATIHNHPTTGYHVFSTADLEATIYKQTKTCIAVSKRETWIVNIDPKLKYGSKKAKEFLKDYDKTVKQIQKEIQKEQDEKVRAIWNKNIPFEEKQKLQKEFLKNLESEEYLAEINDKMNNAVLKTVKKYEDIATFKKVKTNDLPKIIKELNNSKTKVKTKTPSKKPKAKNKVSKPFKKSDYKKDTDRSLEKKQDIEQHKVRYKESERESMNNWGHSGYEDINGYLYKRGEFKTMNKNNARAKSIQKTVDEMDSAIEKSPTLTQDTVLYRAGHWQKGLKVGDEAVWDGFTSTSYNEGVIDGFKYSHRYRITIYAPKGTKGIRLNDQFHSITQEREWMLARGQKYEVIEVDDVKKTAKIRLIT